MIRAHRSTAIDFLARSELPVQTFSRLAALARCKSQRVLASRAASTKRTARATLSIKPTIATRSIATTCAALGAKPAWITQAASAAQQRRAFATKTVQEMIADQVKANKVVLYMKGTPNAPMCGFSRQVVDVLKREGAEFTAYNVLDSDSLRQGIKDFTSWPTIPQLFIEGEFIGGCDIVTDMFREGTLHEALEKAGALKKKAAPAAK